MVKFELLSLSLSLSVSLTCIAPAQQRKNKNSLIFLMGWQQAGLTHPYPHGRLSSSSSSVAFTTPFEGLYEFLLELASLGMYAALLYPWNVVKIARLDGIVRQTVVGCKNT